MKIDPRLPEVVMKDAEGRSVRLGSLWTERPAALLFVRHFG